MPIKVFLADDSDVMRSVIRRTLQEEPSIEVVGEAPSFDKTMQMIADCKPDVLLLDLHLPKKWDFTPELVKAQLGSVCTLAVSLANDDEANALAESYGASALLDKMNLYHQLVPAIMQFSASA
jgi:DNA-binding NarL/FixJ family response regulator